MKMRRSPRDGRIHSKFITQIAARDRSGGGGTSLGRPNPLPTENFVIEVGDRSFWSGGSTRAGWAIPGIRQVGESVETRPSGKP